VTRTRKSVSATSRGREKFFALGEQNNLCAGENACHRNAEKDFGVLNFQADRCIQIRVLRRADFPDRIPELVPRFRLAGLEKTEIRLIVGVDAGHDFDVRSIFAFDIFFREVSIPGVAELVIAPRPLLLAGRNVVVGDVDNARLHLVIITAKEILLAAHAHVGSRHGNVGVKGKVVWRVIGQF
jgi:hypothetical protein